VEIDAEPGFVISTDLNGDMIGDLVTVNADDGLTGGSVTALITKPPCPADLDASGAVGFSDVLVIIAQWGAYAPCPPVIPADLNGNCAVDFADVLAALGEWGPCP